MKFVSMNNMLENIQVYYGPHPNLPDAKDYENRIIAAKMVSPFFEDDYVFSKNSINKLKVLVPKEALANIEFPKIENASTLFLEVLKAFLKIRSSFSHKIEIHKNEDNEKWVTIGYALPTPVILSLRVTTRILLLIYSNVQKIPRKQIDFINELTGLIYSFNPGVSVSNLIESADSRNLPISIIDERKPILSVGQGKNAKIFDYGLTENDSAFGHSIQIDKNRTNFFLKSLGFPTTEQFLVNNIEECHQAIEKLGYPVVIKPSMEGQGKGITANIRNVEQVAPAFQFANQFSRGNVLLERHVYGDDHRINVYQGKARIIGRRRAAYVDGNGIDTISFLITKENERRNNLEDNQGGMYKDITPDNKMINYLNEGGLTLNSVPEKGQRVFLASQANISQGGLSKYFEPDVAHPDVIKMAESVAKAFRIENMGIDFITTDIKNPCMQSSAIVEVNSYPYVSKPLAEVMCEDVLSTKNKGRVEISLVVTDDVSISKKHYEEKK